MGCLEPCDKKYFVVINFEKIRIWPYIKVRNHVIHVSPESGLVTIAGGKWTTYRAMAEETITAAVENCNLEPTSESKTDGLLLGNQINQKFSVI